MVFAGTFGSPGTYSESATLMALDPGADHRRCRVGARTALVMRGATADGSAPKASMADTRVALQKRPPKSLPSAAGEYMPRRASARCVMPELSSAPRLNGTQPRTAAGTTAAGFLAAATAVLAGDPAMHRVTGGASWC